MVEILRILMIKEINVLMKILKKEVIKQAKKIAQSPYNLAVNINNNS